MPPASTATTSAEHSPGAGPSLAPVRPGVPAQALVAALGRAVQRATIYPAGHPAVAATAAPLVTAVRAALVNHDRLVLGVTRGRLFVGPAPEASVACEAPWLSARLSACRVAALWVDKSFDLPAAGQLIDRLARGADTPASEWPPMAGVEVVPVDYTAARFRETPVAERGPSHLAWQAMVRMLAGEETEADEPPADPEALAQYVAQAIGRLEGTGVGSLSEQLAAVTAGFEALPEGTRADVKQRLARFVAALAPPLRRQLVASRQASGRGLLPVLAQLVDGLPASVLVDIIERLEFVPDDIEARIDLVLRLAEQARRDAKVAEAFAARCVREGLPPELAMLDASEARALLDGLLRSRVTPTPSPRPDEDDPAASADADVGQGRSRGRTTGQRMGALRGRFVDPTSPHALDAQQRALVLWLVAMPGGTPAERLACVARVRDDLGQYLRDADFVALARAAHGFEAVVADCPGSEAADVARAALAFFAERTTLDALLARVLARDQPLTAHLVAVAQAGGRAAAEALMTAAATRPDPSARARVAGVFGGFGDRRQLLALPARHRRDLGVARDLLALLGAVRDASLVAEATYLLLGDRDPLVRRDACRLLFRSPLSAGRAEALLRRVLDDEDVRVVACGLDQAPALLPGAARALLALVDRRPTGALVPLQRRAIRMLAAHPGPELCAALGARLGRRRLHLDAASRAVGAELAAALETVCGVDGQRAARAWRRSPAGVLTRLLGD